MGQIARLAFGSLLVASFFGLQKTEVGLDVTFTGGFTNSTPSELYLWLATAFLLVPGGVLLASTVAAPLVRRAEPVVRALDEASPRALVALGAWLLLGTTLAAVLLNQFVLLGHPITDDEQFIRYGGQLLASGRITEPAPAYLDIMPTWLLYLREGQLTSFDWLGGQIAWAVAELTGTGTAIFGVFAGVFVLGTTLAAAQLFGRRWALVAVVVAITSPMAVLLSATSHAHVVSRGLVAATFAAWFAGRGRGVRWWSGVGLLAGAAFVTRPPEVALLFLPLGVALALDARNAEGRAPVLGLALGAALPVALFLVHSWVVTGSILPARMAPNELGELHSFFRSPFAFLAEPSLLVSRFGANSGYNLFMLSISFWSILGLPAVIAGAGANRNTKLLAAGVVSALGLGLLHDHYGLHLVGPIHYSETVPALVLLTVAGLRRMWDGLAEVGWREHALATVVAGSAFALMVSNVWYLRGLHRQAEIHEAMYSLTAGPDFDDSIVLGPQYKDAWWNVPEFRETQSFVFRWRPMDPGRDDRVLFGHYRPDEPEALRALLEAMPDRRVFVVALLPAAPWLKLVPLESVPNAPR